MPSEFVLFPSDFHPSDALVKRFLPAYHGNCYERAIHWCYGSLMTRDEARYHLCVRTYEAFLAKFWPYSGDVAHPIMGYPTGSGFEVEWSSQHEAELLTTLHWSLSGLFHHGVGEEVKPSFFCSDKRKVLHDVAHMLAKELLDFLRAGGVVNYDHTRISYSGGLVHAHVSAFL